MKLLKKAVPLNGTDIYRAGANNSLFSITEYSYYAGKEIPGCPVKGLLKAEKDPEGRTIVYGYDQYGNANRIRELNDTPDNMNATNLLSLPGKEITKEYNSSGLLIRMVSAEGIETTYEYDNRKNLIKTTVNGTDVTSYSYDYASRVSKIVTPEDYSGSPDDSGTEYTYYPHGKVRTMTDKMGNETVYTYDVYGNLKTETLPNGAEYVYEYDVRNRITIKSIIENGIRHDLEKYEYDLEIGEYGEAQDGETFFRNTVTQFSGSAELDTTHTIMDSLRRPVRVYRPDGSALKTEYNPNSTVNKITDPRGFKTIQKYNGLNLPIEKREEVSPNVYVYTEIEYDKVGRALKEKRAKSYVAEQGGTAGNFVVNAKSYYPDGNIKSEEVYTIDDGLITDYGKKLEYEYDLDGNLSKKSEYIDGTRKITASYQNNYRGKPEVITQGIDNADLAGGGESGATELTTVNTYDKEDRVLTTINP